MSKEFNVNGDCKPEIHYMVDISERLSIIKTMVDSGKYFTINRARQYGKTTTLKALERFLSSEYKIVRLDFQRLGQADFETEQAFVEAFAGEILETLEEPPNEIKDKLQELAAGNSDKCRLRNLFRVLSRWCRDSEKKIVLMIDEVDSSANNQVFLDFLAQLRSYYLERDKVAAFQSVILAGVHDVRNVRRKIRPDEEHKMNSPWNIAADFDVEMSFSQDGIAGMLYGYEADHHTGMDINEIAGLVYDYTSGYPYLVSRLCKLIDEKLAGSNEFPDFGSAWTAQGVLEAVRILLSEKSTLFESLIGKVEDYPELKKNIYDILFGGEKLLYNPDNPAADIAIMFGFVKEQNGVLTVANKIFETRLYNYFLTTGDSLRSPMAKMASNNKSQFFCNGYLNMDAVMEKYVEYFGDIYGGHPQEFDEEEGRRRFLLYICPIINGTGNYYIEPETRNARRMDVVIDYLGERFVIELKIWRGSAYHKRGEKQLTDYLNYFHLKKGYMLSYNFNAKKETGVKEYRFGDSILVEAVV